jgi:hypothetical protein
MERLAATTTGKMGLCGFLLIVLVLPAIAADWAESSDPLLVRLQPAERTKPKQNPPGFSWVRYPNASSYEVLLRGASGSVQTVNTARNWYLPASRLPAGEYFWKVRPKGSAGEWSTERQFRVEADAQVFEVPTEEQLLGYIRARGHPRSLSSGNEGVSAWIDRVHKQKASAVQALEQQARTYAKKPLVDERLVLLVPREQNEKAWVDSLANIRHRTQAESRQIRAAALLWRLTSNGFYLDEAIRRGDALAALDPYGSTSHVAQDQGNRAVAWALTVAFDYLADDLPSGKKVAWLGAIRARTASIYEDLKSGGWRLEQQPLDSHGATNIGYVAAISAILIDRIPESETWFRNSFRSYVHFQSPWGDEDGGYGNGSAYAEYSTWYFVDTWDAIAATTGVNMYEKPWSKGLLRFLACFVPPGSPVHAFSDDAEIKPSSTTLKAFAHRFNDELAFWYARNLIGEEDALSALTNPISSNTAAVVIQAPEMNACLFKHIGWVAMHSRLADRGRISVYFKSSRYGSYNHSHGDQNGFVLIAGGRPLLENSGVNDWYGSPHWKSWYRQTAAHNAITFDGGKGQVTEGEAESARAQGRITRFTTSENIDFVEGDATQAYGGKLTKAYRKLWYVRSQQAIVIRDDIASEISREFEWNAHAATGFRHVDQTTYETRNEDQRVCIDFLTPNSGTAQITEGFPTPPSSKVVPRSWHLRFGTQQAEKTRKFVVALRVGCAGSPARMDGDKVVIGDFSLDTLK